jgi:RNase P subunit RPR2
MNKMLMATCPRCRTEMSTGISADEQTMRELGPKLQVLVLCDNCREYQRMMVKDLYFARVVNAVAA